MPEPTASSVASPEHKWMRAAGVSKLTPTDDLMALVRQRAPDPSVLDELSAPLFLGRAQISNNQPDSYFTRMCAKQGCPMGGGADNCTLGNFAARAAEGVGVQNSHDWRNLGLGRSLTGELVGAQGNGIARAYSDFYITPGLSLSGVVSDDVITALRMGQVRDISVGFYGGTIRCSLCGRSIWDWDCWHIPGVAYVKNDKGNWERAGDDAEGATVAIAWIHGADLSEYSTVYDGATPDAAVTDLKARQEQEAGRVSPRLALLLEQRFRIRLPQSGHRFAGAEGSPAEGAPTTPPEEERTVTEPRKPDEVLAAVRAALVEAGISDVADPAAAVAELGRQVSSAREAAEQEQPLRAALTTLFATKGLELRQGEAAAAGLARVGAFAQDGIAYREQLTKDALDEGVRVHGADWPRATYEAILATLPVATIRQMRDDWKSTADRVLKGGRLTADEAADPHSARNDPAKAADDRAFIPA